ncbi:hypothetical protein K1719_022153 [Acacia pycnantha]|nr:hypothetical protein K1719_022153 [Acacia pycnantha]
MPIGLLHIDFGKSRYVHGYIYVSFRVSQKRSYYQNLQCLWACQSAWLGAYFVRLLLPSNVAICSFGSDKLAIWENAHECSIIWPDVTFLLLLTLGNYGSCGASQFSLKFYACHDLQI